MADKGTGKSTNLPDILSNTGLNFEQDHKTLKSGGLRPNSSLLDVTNNDSKKQAGTKLDFKVRAQSGYLMPFKLGEKHHSSKAGKGLTRD